MRDPHETAYVFAEDEANRISKEWSAQGLRMYYTAIKGKPYNPEEPDKCWKVTNRFNKFELV